MVDGEIINENVLYENLKYTDHDVNEILCNKYRDKSKFLLFFNFIFKFIFIYFYLKFEYTLILSIYIIGLYGFQFYHIITTRFFLLYETITNLLLLSFILYKIADHSSFMILNIIGILLLLFSLMSSKIYMKYYILLLELSND